MKTLVLNSLLFPVALILSFVACGGPPAPIVQHTIAMETIAKTPAQERSLVADAYRAHYLSKVEVEHQEFLLRDIEFELRIAKVKSREMKQREELSSLEVARNNAMYKELAAKKADIVMQSLKKSRDSQNQQITYLKAQRNYLKKQLRHSIALETHAHARFELTKAQLAQKRQILPKNFKMERFVAQEKRAKDQVLRREKGASTAKSKAAALKSKNKSSGKN